MSDNILVVEERAGEIRWPTESRTEPAATAPAKDDSAVTGIVDRWCRHQVQRQLDRMLQGAVQIVETSADTGRRPQPTILVHDGRFYRRAIFGGSLGIAESYLRGQWSADDLVRLLRTLARNINQIAAVDRGFVRFLSPIRSLRKWLRRNTKAGSRRNIAAHYDLSNQFFSLMLDPTMTYSAGIFDTEHSTMEQASIAKYERICQKLALTSADHLLEIGTGWGGLAIYAARNYGCKVTTATISPQQYQYAKQKVHEQGCDHLIDVRLQDYRDLRGRFDKIVSVEMIEAVGEKSLGQYFQQCSRLLAPAGMMLLQSITMPDHRHDAYRTSLEFIQQYIFPGGFLPAFSTIGRAVRRNTDFRLFHCEDFGSHYARTLAHWRERFWANIDEVRQLGFDERFVRMWHYYLCYCEAGFAERQIGVAQMLLTKPQCRRDPILGSI